MWLCTSIGFFSIVRKDGACHVRARVRSDLERLADRAGLDRSRIEEWPQADYRWRILATGAELGTVMAALADTVDYPNFKSRIHATPHQDAKSTAYGRLWADLLGLQAEGAAPAAARMRMTRTSGRGLPPSRA